MVQGNKMKKILFYYPSNKQSNALETLILELAKRGYEIILLTTCEKGDFHISLESNGIKYFTNYLPNQKGIVYYFKQIAFLITFCKKNHIDIVCSHLQHVNFISVLAQFFSRSRFIIFRHHFKFNVFSNDTRLEANKTEVLFDKVINALAKEIIVPSNGVFSGMLNFEKVSKSKLQIIPYVYNFDNYQKPNMLKVAEIRSNYSCDLLLLMCSRLILFKRHYIVFPVIKILVNHGLNIKLIVLDEGPEKENLQRYIIENSLQNNIFLLGYKTDFINYMASCDLMIHPSLTEASSSAVKEMGLLNKAVAVCSKVGDFDDYIENYKNGFLLPPIDTEIFLEKLIRELYFNRNLLSGIGEKLNKTVMNIYNKSEEILSLYDNLFSK